MPQTPRLQPEGLRELRAYQLAKQPAHLVYDVTSGFPRTEFRLIDQMRGAAVSVFGNIAEGYGRNSIGDYARFCQIARGSLAEVASYIEFCHERQMVTAEQQTQILDLRNHSWNTLGALIRSLRGKQADGSWDRSYRAREEGEDYV
jgi:four helix bundle protein